MDFFARQVAVFRTPKPGSFYVGSDVSRTLAIVGVQKGHAAIIMDDLEIGRVIELDERRRHAPPRDDSDVPVINTRSAATSR
jgi:hypothetical protein